MSCEDFGLRPAKPDSEYDPAQLKAGIEVEKEHTTSDEVAKCIAKHHLDEFHNYYRVLKHMEEILVEIDASCQK